MHLHVPLVTSLAAHVADNSFPAADPRVDKKERMLLVSLVAHGAGVCFGGCVGFDVIFVVRGTLVDLATYLAGIYDLMIVVDMSIQHELRREAFVTPFTWKVLPIIGVRFFMFLQVHNGFSTSVAFF